MKKGTAAALIAASALLVLAAVGATYAWFVSLNQTPTGVVDSALIRWLPEAGERSVPSLVKYGSLISGSSIDPDGTPLVIPGDRLLSGVTTTVDTAAGITTQSVRTSIARAYRSGETEGTVIHGELRYFEERDDMGTVTGVKPAARTQRDLMDAPDPVSTWYDGTGAVLASPPAITPGLYDVTTTSDTVTTAPVGQTVTVTTLTTTYTTLKDKVLDYTHTVVTTTTVTHEAARFSPAGFDPAAWDAALALPRYTYEETVLSVPEDPTESSTVRTRMVITEQRAWEAGDAAATKEAALPLGLENCSTADSNLRIAFSATVVRSGSDGEVLTAREQDGVTYFGKEQDGHFIELIALAPASGDGFAWARSSGEASDGAGRTWTLWDLTVPDGEGSAAMTARIPGLPAAEADAPAPQPVYYPAVQALSVVSTPHFMGGVENAQAIFETAFNELYCKDLPIIQLRLRYYSRQADYMDWTEFYSDSISFSAPAPAP